jgi:hypothetical protein
MVILQLQLQCMQIIYLYLCNDMGNKHGMTLHLHESNPRNGTLYAFAISFRQVFA